MVWVWRECFVNPFRNRLLLADGASCLRGRDVFVGQSGYLGDEAFCLWHRHSGMVAKHGDVEVGTIWQLDEPDVVDAALQSVGRRVARARLVADHRARRE